MGNDLVLVKYLKNENSTCKTLICYCCWSQGRLSVGMPSVTATVTDKASARDRRAESQVGTSVFDLIIALEIFLKCLLATPRLDRQSVV